MHLFGCRDGLTREFLAASSAEIDSTLSADQARITGKPSSCIDQERDRVVECLGGSMLLWTYEEAGTFSSQLGGLRLMVAETTGLSIYRYQVLKPVSDPTFYVSIASGHRPTLQDAFNAAEDAAGQLTTTH